MYYQNLTKKYPVSKTIRNELIPIGKTLENIRKNNILESDVKRKQDYEHVKGIMDEYHKQLINEALDNYMLPSLNQAAEIYLKKHVDVEDREDFKKTQDLLRREVTGRLKEHENYTKIGKKDILDLLEKLPSISEEDYNALESFRNFYTYFTSYNKVRENLYSDEEKSSTVAYRLINENLPKFLDNIKSYAFVKAAGVLADCIEEEEQDALFMVETFNMTLTQEGIDMYNYQIGKVNSAINLYNQKNHKVEEFKKIPKMKVLYKQILSDREEVFIGEFKDDETLLSSIGAYGNVLMTYLKSEKINIFFDALRESEGKNVYVKNDLSKTTMSNIVFGSWSAFDELLNQEYDLANENKKKDDKYFEKRQKELKKNKSYTLEQMSNLSKEDISPIENYIERISEDIEKICIYNGEFEKIVVNEHDSSRKLSKNIKAVKVIKDYLDSIKELEHDIKLINGSGQELEKNLVVYVGQEEALEQLRPVDSLYNLTRNYLTKKPFSTEKVKLNFNKSTLLNGWDKNKETDNLGILFFKDGKYYLGIMNTTANKAFVNPPAAKTENVFKKVDYKLLPGSNKMLPKVFFAKSNIGYYNPSIELYSNYKKGTHKKGPSFSIDDCHNLIDFFKESIKKHEDWSKFGFEFSDTADYRDISEFYREVEKQGYKLTFTDIDESYINDLIEKNELYLFQIYNKDFSEYSKGKLNLHTLYFMMLFDQRNLDNVVYKLNGEAEVFYRPASIAENELVIHKAGEGIKNKNPNRAKVKETSTFSYDIVKDKRYSKYKFTLHIPITMNFGVDEVRRFNDVINNALRTDDNVNVIGIDRGERNLLYVVVINSEGKILEQISLNSIINKEYDIETNYHALLDEREDDRNKARKDWNTIENIKELKTGYLSQVVNVVAKLVLKYNAIICLEDLNFGFKRGRQKVEKQVYQKFEKMLIEKLNYLVIDKSREQVSPEKMGGALNALQLTSKFKSFAELGKQSGIIYYVPAYLTSKIDPTTGFVNLFYIKYENIEKAKQFFDGFDFIRFNKKDDMFEFSFDYKSFTQKACGIRSKWIVYTNGERIIKYPNPEKNNLFDEKVINVTDEIKGLFKQYRIPYENGEDIKEIIISKAEADFYKRLFRLLHQTLQMRNSTSDGTRDYIISPVKNDRGEFFCSEFSEGTMPKDADANGAYNIARKGLWVLEQIRQKDEGEKVNLSMTNAEWLKYAQLHLL